MNKDNTRRPEPRDVIQKVVLTAPEWRELFGKLVSLQCTNECKDVFKINTLMEDCCVIVEEEVLPFLKWHLSGQMYERS